MNIQAMTVTPEAAKGFYPTPPELADKLLDGIDPRYIETMLEPSAGKGDLVKAVLKKADQANYAHLMLDVDCVEIDPHLRSILSYEFGSGLKKTGDWRSVVTVQVVHDDFLTFQSRKRYDLILMNPPFADGDAHLLKAIELQKRYGGQIRCLLNAETLLNPYTNRRKVLQTELSEWGADVEYIEGGFKEGERATGVTVALIKISIPQAKEDSDIFQRLSEAAHIDEETVQVGQGDTLGIADRL